MSKKIRLLGGAVIAATIIVAAVACAEDEEKKKELTVVSSPTIVREVAPATEISVGPGIQRLVDLAVADLTTKLNIESEDIMVIQAEHVTWRDSSAGCPQPDTQYMQVLTDGSRILEWQSYEGLGYDKQWCAVRVTVDPSGRIVSVRSVSGLHYAIGCSN